MPSYGAPPYPVDAAALHHVFPGGWIWMLRFNNGVTSAGAALTDRRGRAERPRMARAAWDRLLARLPSVARAVPLGAAGAAVRPRAAAGVPQPPGGGRVVGAPAFGGGRDRSAALDRLSADAPRHPCACSISWSARRRATTVRRRLREYEHVTLAELDATERLVAALYATMADPPLFKQLEPALFRGRELQRGGRGGSGGRQLAPGIPAVGAIPISGPSWPPARWRRCDGPRGGRA